MTALLIMSVISLVLLVISLVVLIFSLALLLCSFYRISTRSLLYISIIYSVSSFVFSFSSASRLEDFHAHNVCTFNNTHSIVGNTVQSLDTYEK